MAFKYSFIILLLFLSGCVSSIRFATEPDSDIDGNTTQENPLDSSKAMADKAEEPTVIQSFEGIASYYANKFHGRTTASGEVHNKHELTAAHKKLPFGTIVRVTNKRNGKSVVVRINDRGPFAKKRVIDLSRAAAEEIDMIRAGLVEVLVEVLSIPE